MIYDYLICDDDGKEAQVFTGDAANNTMEHARGLSMDGKIYRVYGLFEIYSYQNGNEVEGMDYAACAGKSNEERLKSIERGDEGLGTCINHHTEPHDPLPNDPHFRRDDCENFALLKRLDAVKANALQGEIADDAQKNRQVAED